MATTLSAHEEPLFKIFSNEYVFSIPGYQRPYAWTTEQARDLFEDLTGFMDACPGAVEGMPPYFLGSIVLIKKDGLPPADVVDGQQRLTTLTILLSAIRANITGPERENITFLLYEKGSKILGAQDRFRLGLRERDRAFFQDHVQREDGWPKLLAPAGPLSDSQKRIRDNAIYFDEQLKDMPEARRLDLAQFIVTRCYLVVVATPDLDAAYRIFSVLNSRGLDLAATDILKADIIGGIDERRRDAYTRKWEEMEEDLGREAFGDLFSHVRMIFRQAKPQGTLLKEFREHVTKGRPPTAVVDDTLAPYAAAYEELTDEAYVSTELAEQVNASLRWLNRLEFKDWMPPALAFAVPHRNAPAAMDRFVRDLERLAYCLLITRAGINERIERFSRLTNAILAGADLFAERSPLQLSASEQAAALRVLSGPLYESLSARARTTVLLRLDALLSGGGASYNYDIISVEHVLPQNPAPGSQWCAWFPDSEQREVWVHRLGNLALLTRKKNSAASNYEFEKKKEAYFKKDGVSPFPLTTQVLAHSEWRPEIVAGRQSLLVRCLQEHWRLEGRPA